MLRFNGPVIIVTVWQSTYRVNLCKLQLFGSFQNRANHTQFKNTQEYLVVIVCRQHTLSHLRLDYA